MVGKQERKRFRRVMLGLKRQYSPCANPELLLCFDDVGSVAGYPQPIRRALAHIAVNTGAHNVLYGL